MENVDVEKYPPAIGITMELCAGIVDKDLPIIEIAREEVLEECGYDVPIERIEEVMTYRFVIEHFIINRCLRFNLKNLFADLV